LTRSQTQARRDKHGDEGSLHPISRGGEAWRDSACDDTQATSLLRSAVFSSRTWSLITMTLAKLWNQLRRSSCRQPLVDGLRHRRRKREYPFAVEPLEPIALLSAGFGGASVGHSPRAVTFAAADHRPAVPALVRPLAVKNPNRVTSIQILPRNVPQLLHAGQTVDFTAVPYNASHQPVNTAIPRVRFRIVNPLPADRVAAFVYQGSNDQSAYARVIILSPKGPMISRNSSARVFAFLGNLSSKPILVTREASPYDGTYSGSYLGTVTGFGHTVASQGPVLFTVTGTIITVSIPGAGSGIVSRDGNGNFTSGAGSVSGASFTAHFIRWRSGAITVAGTWSVNNDGVTGGGSWQATLRR
jgi:hypothetical protein